MKFARNFYIMLMLIINVVTVCTILRELETEKCDVTFSYTGSQIICFALFVALCCDPGLDRVPKRLRSSHIQMHPKF